MGSVVSPTHSSRIVLFLVMVTSSQVWGSWKSAGEKALTLKAGVASSALRLRVEPSDTTRLRNVEYVPNMATKGFVSASYDWFGFTISSYNALDSGEAFRKGKSSGQDWQFRFNFDEFSFEVFYQNYLGYYIENTSDFQSQPEGMPFLQNSSLRAEHIGWNFLWNLNPKDFSISAATDQHSIQTESGWSWLAGVSFHAARFSTAEGLIPSVVLGSYGDVESVRSARLYSLLAGAGAGGTWVPFDDFFVSGALLVYFGPEFQRVEQTTGDTSQTLSTFKNHAKVSLGYSGKSWMSGITAHTDSSSYQITNAKVVLGLTESIIFVGRRF